MCQRCVSLMAGLRVMAMLLPDLPLNLSNLLSFVEFQTSDKHVVKEIWFHLESLSRLEMEYKIMHFCATDIWKLNVQICALVLPSKATCVWVCLFFLCVIHLHPFTFRFHIYHLKSSRNTHLHLQHLNIHARRGRSYLLIRRFSFSSSSLLYIGSGCEVSWSKCCSKSKLTQILFGENCFSADACTCAVCHSLEASITPFG